jgi:DNA-binding NarL/FixJ family response regulator
MIVKQVIAYDDEPALRKQLENYFYVLRTEFKLLATFPNALAVEDNIRVFSPNIVLLDIDMRETDEDGLIALYTIKQKYPKQKVMMLTTFDDDEKIFNAICLGADGYMLKSDFVHLIPHEVLRRSLNMILSDGAYLTPSVAKKILLLFRDATVGDKIQKVVARFKNLFSQTIKTPTVMDYTYQLKEIQVQILEQIVAGKSSPQISREMDIPENTINHHIKGIYRELEVHTRAHAVRKAIEERIVKLEKK